MNILKLKKILFSIIISYAFIFAGTLQFTGLLGITGGTFVILFFIFFIFLLSGKRVERIKITRFHFISFFFLLYIWLVGFLQNNDISYIILYSMYLIIPLGLLFIFKGIKIWPYTFFKTLTIISILQIPILLIQNVYGSLFGKLSAKKFAEIDSLFGTFPIADDHGLGFFFLAMIGFCLFVVEKKTTWIKFVITTNIFGLFLSNSEISKLLLIVLFGIYFLKTFRFNFKLNFRYLSLIIIGLYFLFQSDLLITLGKTFNKAELLDFSEGKSTVLIENGTAGRIQTISYFLHQPVLMIGHGPFSYYDPFKDVFNLNLNFSQFIWFYYDIGLIGIGFFILWLFALKKNIFNYKNIFTEFLFFSLIIYSFFTTTLNSITILTIFFLFQFYQEYLLKNQLESTNKI